MSVAQRDFIVGGGIVGLVLGYKLKMRYPKKMVLVLEKEQTRSAMALAEIVA